MELTTRPLAALLAATLIAGCAADVSEYPSLARRPIERQMEAPPAPPPPPEAPAAPSAELTARLDQLVAQARAAHARFESREARARQLARAASGAAIASESWAVATIAVSDLESARSEVMIALADLDGMHAVAVVEGKDAAPIAAARESVTALVREEDRVLAELRGSVVS
jgi:type IV secretory pathway VirB10-like protein